MIPPTLTFVFWFKVEYKIKWVSDLSITTFYLMSTTFMFTLGVQLVYNKKISLNLS